MQSIRAISSSLSTLMSPSLRITAANERSAVGEYYVISKKHVDESSSYAADFSHFKKPLPNCVYACHDYPCEYGLLGHDGHRLSGQRRYGIPSPPSLYQVRHFDPLPRDGH